MDLTRKLKSFTPNDLAEILIESFLKEFGEIKTKEIISKVFKSEKVATFVIAHTSRRMTPSGVQITHLLNTIRYFIFSKGETLCLGSVSVFKLWQESFENMGYVVNDEDYKSSLIDLIQACSRTKFSSNNNFFTRFYDRIEFIYEQREQNNLLPVNDGGGKFRWS